MRRVRCCLPQCRRHAFHCRQGDASELAAAGTTATRSPHIEYGCRHDQRAFWELHEPWRVRSGLPQEDSHRVYRKDEPRPDPRHAASSRRVARELWDPLEEALTSDAIFRCLRHLAGCHSIPCPMTTLLLDPGRFISRALFSIPTRTRLNAVSSISLI